MGAAIVSDNQSTTQKVGRAEWRVSTDLNTGEGDLFSILGNDKRPSVALVVQYSPELYDLQILVTNVLDSGNDPQHLEKSCRLSGATRC